MKKLIQCSHPWGVKPPLFFAHHYEILCLPIFSHYGLITGINVETFLILFPDYDRFLIIFIFKRVNDQDEQKSKCKKVTELPSFP